MVDKIQKWNMYIFQRRSVITHNCDKIPKILSTEKKFVMKKPLNILWFGSQEKILYFIQMRITFLLNYYTKLMKNSNSFWNLNTIKYYKFFRSN